MQADIGSLVRLVGPLHDVPSEVDGSRRSCFDLRKFLVNNEA